MADKHGICIKISGLPTLANFSIIHKNNQSMMTLFTVEMLKRGFLGYRQFKSSFSHTKKDLSKYAKAVDEVFQIIANNSSVLNTPPAHSGFTRLTNE